MSWIGFFISFVSTFAAAPMVAIISEDLELTKPDLGSAGLAAVTGTIAARVVSGVHLRCRWTPIRSVHRADGDRPFLLLHKELVSPPRQAFSICHWPHGHRTRPRHFRGLSILDVLHVQRQVRWNR